jgi:hypothetical protein
MMIGGGPFRSPSKGERNGPHIASANPARPQTHTSLILLGVLSIILITLNHEQSAVLEMGEHFQGSDDDRGSD